jgi:hypothetical protein
MKDEIQNLEENILYMDHTKEINSRILEIPIINYNTDNKNNNNNRGENSLLKEEYLFNIEALIKGKKK